jgi:hypothetical protein
MIRPALLHQRVFDVPQLIPPRVLEQLGRDRIEPRDGAFTNPDDRTEPNMGVRRSLIVVLDLSIDLAIAASLDETQVHTAPYMRLRSIRRRITCRRDRWEETSSFTKERNMQLHKLILVLATALAPINASAQLSSLADDGDLRWVRDSKRAYEQAKADNKPVLVYVWSERGDAKTNPLWHDTTRGMWKDDEVSKESRRFVCLSVDADSKDPSVERFLRERAQVIFTDPSGNVLAKFKGRDGGLWIEFQPDEVLAAMRKLRWPRK